eukprot:1109304-Alexandrium_andersonii.AAC.1
MPEAFGAQEPELGEHSVGGRAAGLIENVLPGATERSIDVRCERELPVRGPAQARGGRGTLPAEEAHG